MTENEYKNWSMQFLAKTPEANKNVFLEFVHANRFLKKGETKSRVESSFNNKDRFDFLKVSHCLYYPLSSKERVLAEVIEGKRLSYIFSKIIKETKFKINLDLLNSILGTPISQGKADDAVIIYTDFDYSSGNFLKVSLGFNPFDTESFFQLGKLLKIDNWQSVYLNFKKREGVIIDFYANGRIGLKVYQKINNSREDLGKDIWPICQMLKKFVPVYSFSMTRLNDKDHFLENKYFCCEGIEIDQLLMIDYFKKDKEFLLELKKLIKNFKIHFIGIKDNFFEIYFK